MNIKRKKKSVPPEINRKEKINSNEKAQSRYISDESSKNI
jgi:hypothetical protein